MTKLNLSLVALLAMGTLSSTNASEVPVLNEFYIGIGYGQLGASYQEEINGNTFNISSDEDFSQAMVQTGYKINPYFAFEGRYWVGMSDQNWENISNNGFNSISAQVDTWALYTKFIAPLGDSFNLYALLGYASATYSIEGENFESGNDVFDGFSWGVGADVSFSENFGVFVDYVTFYDDKYTNYRGNEANTRLDSVNFGMTYTFTTP
jgi:hypothetical protein